MLMRVVVALGGNALLERGEPPLAENQIRHLELAAEGLRELAADHQLVVTHGNGPQVGLLSLESSSDAGLSHPYPLDVLGAETQGMIGYLLAQSLTNHLPGREVVVVVTRTVVGATDPAFGAPTKFVGPIYDHDSADRLARAHGWIVRPDGEHWRRVVPSPEPLQIVEGETILRLVESGCLVVCAGGGGVPVIRDRDQYRGVEAVIDKDLTAAVLADDLHADVLLILTDVPGVEKGFGGEHPIVIGHIEANSSEMADLPSGSMGPKVAAARRFARVPGRRAIIGALCDVGMLLKGSRGTDVSMTSASLGM
jgi:carbamate kinase